MGREFSLSPNRTFAVRVNGKTVDAIRDTGASALIVDEGLVPHDAPRAGSVTLTGFRKDFSGSYPVVLVSVETPFYSGDTWAISVPGLLYPVLVGNSLHLETGVREVDFFWPPATASPAVTRSRAKSGDPDPENLAQQFPDPATVGLTKSEFIRLQGADPSLKSLRRAATSIPNSCYFMKDGVLYRRAKPSEDTHSQLVVPSSLREEVLRQGHDRPLAGHMGVQRTLQRVQREFFWPKMGREIRQWCRSCDICQRSAPAGGNSRVPLGTMPGADVPFRQVAIDLAGPIKPRSSSGNAYVLCVVDYATRYPEAVPLRNIEAATVAEALFGIYSRVGFPQVAVTDQGSQFTSELYKEMCRLEGIERHTTSPYHPQSNGLVERFNQTFKGILRKLCLEHPKDWDRYLPALLFAYRDVPQESTGFSPFELLYGHSVTSPLTILRRLWTEESTDSESRAMGQYVFDLRKRIEETCKLAQRSVKEAQQRQKRVFDRHALERYFDVGDQVLLLRPQKKNKLQVAWRGPFTVKERIGDWNYRISLPGKTRVYHANLLKKYIARESLSFSHHAAAGVIPPVVDQLDYDRLQDSVPFIPLSSEETWRDVCVSSDLSPDQSRSVRQLCYEFRDILSDRPHRTDLSQCELKLHSQDPIRVRPYPIPHSQEETVREEVQAMLDLGAIERSDSPFSSPIVLVKKKDGKIRFCIDYRRLNKELEFDGEPMPDVGAIFSSVSGCKYFSKLDLAKGYWQIPMAESSKPLTAFTTPQGQFQWNVMPFGLKTAGAIFSRMMRKLIVRARDPCIHNFIDDVLIASPTCEEHLASLRRLFACLRQANLAVRPTKCSLGETQVSFLGHLLGHEQLMPESDKVSKVREAPRPTTKKQVRSFLGLVGFYRKFIPHFAEKALPLTNLTKGSAPDRVRWDDACEASYSALKESICSSPVLRLPDPSRTFILRTDASYDGLGAALGQDHDGSWHPVAFASKKLSDTERRYHTIELECYAVVWGIRRFYPYLYGRHFIVECDHHPLSALHKIRPVSRRLVGWSMEFQSHQFDVRYIKGATNVEADFLSRIPSD